MAVRQGISPESKLEWGLLCLQQLSHFICSWRAGDEIASWELLTADGSDRKFMFNFWRFGLKVLLTQQNGYEPKQYNTFQEYSPIERHQNSRSIGWQPFSAFWEIPGSNVGTGTDKIRWDFSWLHLQAIESQWVEDFPCSPERPRGPHNFLYKGYGIIPEGNVDWAWWSPPTSF